MMSIANLEDIDVETLRIDSGYYLEKEFTKLIHINLSMELYLIINQVELFHGCVYGPWT